MSMSLFTQSEHLRLIKEVQRVAFMAFSSFWRLSWIHYQDVPLCCSLHTLLCPDTIQGFLSHAFSLLHLRRGRSIFSSQKSPPLPLSIYPEFCPGSVLRNYLFSCSLSLSFRVWAYKPGLWAGRFQAGLSGIWCESDIAPPRQLRTILAATGSRAWVYTRKENPRAVLVTLQCKCQRWGRGRCRVGRIQRAQVFWNLLWKKQFRSISLASWIEGK